MKKRKYSYPEHWPTLTVKQIARINNGCGPAGWKGLAVPDQIAHIDLEEACKIHDVEYYFGKTKKDKKIADKRFFKNMKTAIWNSCKTRIGFYILLPIAYIYYWAVKKGGNSYFLEGKKGFRINHLTKKRK